MLQKCVFLGCCILYNNSTMHNNALDNTHGRPIALRSTKLPQGTSKLQTVASVFELTEMADPGGKVSHNSCYSDYLLDFAACNHWTHWQQDGGEASRLERYCRHRCSSPKALWVITVLTRSWPIMMETSKKFTEIVLITYGIRSLGQRNQRVIVRNLE